MLRNRDSATRRFGAVSRNWNAAKAYPKTGWAPEAALDLVEIWRQLKNEAGIEIAERVERAFAGKSSFWRARPERTLAVAIPHGNRDVERILFRRIGRRRLLRIW
jgi:plasmid stabilization system protein ParE